MPRKARKGVPALRNEDVTGMTEAKQERIARETGRGPRTDAAKKFYDEQEDEASRTSPPRE